MVRLILVLALLLLSSDAQADVRRVWAVGDGDKVERDEQNHPASARNAVWDGRVVRLFAARNEIIAFQVIVEADGDGISQLSVRLPELVSATDRITYQPPGADPTNSVGRPIQIFTTNYMLVSDAVQCALGLRARIAGCALRSDRLEAGPARSRERQTRAGRHAGLDQEE